MISLTMKIPVIQSESFKIQLSLTQILKHMSFTDLQLINPLLKAIEEQGYKTPTLVQQKTIPFVLDKSLYPAAKDQSEFILKEGRILHLQPVKKKATPLYRVLFYRSFTFR